MIHETRQTEKTERGGDALRVAVANFMHAAHLAAKEITILANGVRRNTAFITTELYGGGLLMGSMAINEQVENHNPLGALAWGVPAAGLVIDGFRNIISARGEA